LRLLFIIAVGGANKHSDFVVTLEKLALTSLPPDDSQAAIVASIRNLGSPSIAEAWHLSVRLGDKEYQAEPLLMITPVGLTVPDGQETYYPRDALYEKTSTPIFAGERK
jgi:hypothetical protein